MGHLCVLTALCLPAETSLGPTRRTTSRLLLGTRNLMDSSAACKDGSNTINIRRPGHRAERMNADLIPSSNISPIGSHYPDPSPSGSSPPLGRIPRPAPTPGLVLSKPLSPCQKRGFPITGVQLDAGLHADEGQSWRIIQ